MNSRPSLKQVGDYGVPIWCADRSHVVQIEDQSVSLREMELHIDVRWAGAALGGHRGQWNALTGLQTPRAMRGNWVPRHYG